MPKERGELNKLRCCQDISDWSVGIVISRVLSLMVELRAREDVFLPLK